MWSKRLSNERITALAASGNSFAPKLTCDHDSKRAITFEENYLNEGKVSLIDRNIVKRFTVYESDTWLRDLTADFMVQDDLFVVVELNKNADPDKQSFSGYVLIQFTTSFFNCNVCC